MIVIMRQWSVYLSIPMFLVLLSSDVEARRRAGGYGQLAISSMTHGARVLVDGRDVGILPLPGSIRLKVGQHTLKIIKKGYTEYLDVFRIKRNRETKLDIDLLPFAGVIEITASVEGARVFIDGKFQGLAPLEREVLIGERAIRVTKAGFYEYVGKVKSIAGKTSKIHVELEPMPVGTTPYRPPPPPPPKWYEKWYVWAGAAGGVVAVTLAVVIPVVLSQQDPVADFCDPNCDFKWQTK